MWLLLIMAVATYVSDAKYLLVDIQEDNTEGGIQGIARGGIARGKFLNDFK